VSDVADTELQPVSERVLRARIRRHLAAKRQKFRRKYVHGTISYFIVDKATGLRPFERLRPWEFEGFARREGLLEEWEEVEDVS
jgi:hypothetical protein